MRMGAGFGGSMGVCTSGCGRVVVCGFAGSA